MIITGALAAIILAGAYFYLPPQNDAPALNSVADVAPAQLAAPATKAAPINDNKVLDASGYITARQIATVSSEVTGLILSVDVEEGMRVEKNQILATIDDEIAQVHLELSKKQVDLQISQLKSLSVELAEAKRELNRVSGLSQAGSYSSQAELSQAQTKVDRLNANILAARDQIALGNLEVKRQQSLIDNYIIRAPFSGIVIGKNAQAGEIVAPGSAGGGFTRTGICTIVDMDSLEIQVDVNESYINRVKPNQPVIAVLDAYPNWEIPASVIAIIPTADRGKATIRVRIKIHERDERILPDMGVKVSFLKEE